jgi:hypothetical protein
MKRPIVIMSILCGGICLHMAMPAAAQNFGPYISTPYASAPVSPYVNLGFNQNGISNYQSLVRPMIDEQEGLMRQTASLQQLQRQMRGPQSIPDPNDPARNPNIRTQSVRWMHYSHFYSGLR